MIPKLLHRIAEVARIVLTSLLKFLKQFYPNFCSAQKASYLERKKWRNLSC
jgi:hypothetical protein